MNKKSDKKSTIQQLWRLAHLSWKLDPNQKQLYELYHQQKDKINTWVLARRSGKSHTLLVLALEVCLKNPNSIVKFIAPTKLQLKSYIEPLLRKLCSDAPDDLKPKFSTKEYSYIFSNGSIIELAGADNGHAEKLRGSDAHLVIVDEAGSIDNLKYIVTSILLPTTLITKGKIILASTPPRTADHEFTKFIEKAQTNNTLIKKTIYDNPRLSPEDIQMQIDECGGPLSESFQREYLCNQVKDPTTSVIPEFDDSLRAKIVKEWKKPAFFDSYVSMDLGFKDLTVVLFGYYDFRAAKLIIEDEIVANFQDPDMTLPKLTRLIDEKEKTLWTNTLTHEVKRPTLRVSDINHIVVQEIARSSNKEITFSNARKYDNEAAINNMRVMLSTEKVIINPRCKTLVTHLENVRWSSNKSKVGTFDRSQDNGHYDAVDALKYMIRSLNTKKNPFPATYEAEYSDLFGPLPEKKVFHNNYQVAFKKIFKPKPGVWRK